MIDSVADLVLDDGAPASPEAVARTEQIAASWFVLRHSGREGEPWRVAYESGSETEARAEFRRILPRTPISYACTVLVYGSPFGPWDSVDRDGIAPEAWGIPTWQSARRAREAREKREARARQIRIEVTPPRLRIAEPPEPHVPGLDVAEDDIVEQEAGARAPARLRVGGVR